jgi:pimeloyl-ACP methyl ester carboxylesterase
MTEQLQIRIHGDPALPVLVYLPGTHGDWTLIGNFRQAFDCRVRFVEFTYPRTLEWSLVQYADAVEAALLEQGITHGWVVGESFGSQVAWQLVAPGRRFCAEGLVLAGGFIRHPFLWEVRAARVFFDRISLAWMTRLLGTYARLARFRFRKSPVTIAGIQEFVERRTELDQRAIVHRLRLIHGHDPREIAGAVTVPVYQLTGFFDPAVAWPWVRRWLRKHCPALKDSRVILSADHNVLGTAPGESARQVLQWMAGH